MPRRLTAILFGLLSPIAAMAQMIPPCPVGSVLPCPAGIYANGALGLVAYVTMIIFPAIRTGFIGVATVMFAVYAGRLLFQADEDQTVTDIKNAYSSAVTGAVFISIATFIVDSFGRPASAVLVNPVPITFAINNVIGYFKIIIGVLLSIVITTQGIRLMLLQGQEAEIEKLRKRFLYSLLGVGVILLANVIVEAVQPGANSVVINEEVRGIVNFALELFAGLAVLSILVAGAILILSPDESSKETARKIVFATVISLIVVLSAYSIINYFLFL